MTPSIVDGRALARGRARGAEPRRSQGRGAIGRAGRGDRRRRRAGVRPAGGAARRTPALRGRADGLRAVARARDAINAAIFDEAEAIGVGSLVIATGEVARVPVGPGLLGRVVDPLGRPLDRDEPIAAEAFHADRAAARPRSSTARSSTSRSRPACSWSTRCSRSAAASASSSSATAPPARRRSRSTRSSTRSASDMVCVYVAVGQRATAVERVVEAGEERARPERCVFVVASAAAVGGAAMDRALRRLHHRRIFPRQGRPRAGRRRRSDQARRDPPRACAAHPRAARARGLSRRHLLCPRAASRTRGQARARTRRRVADRAADRGDRRRQSLGLHPDQPHLDHRRADRAEFAPVRRQPAPGGGRRPERQPRRRQGAGAGLARGFRPAAARLFAVSRTRDVHPLRRPRRHARARRRSRAASASARCSPSRASRRCVSSIRSRCSSALADGVFDDAPVAKDRRGARRGSRRSSTRSRRTASRKSWRRAACDEAERGEARRGGARARRGGSGP